MIVIPREKLGMHIYDIEMGVNPFHCKVHGKKFRSNLLKDCRCVA